MVENDPPVENPCFECDLCGYASKSEVNFKIHKQIKTRLEQLILDSKKTIENVPDEEPVFTAEELATFGLDWKVFEELCGLSKDVDLIRWNSFDLLDLCTYSCI